MFLILMNGNVMDTVNSLSSAIKKAEKIKLLFCKGGEVVIESKNGFVLQRF